MYERPPEENTTPENTANARSGRHTGESDTKVDRPTGTGGGGIDPASYE